MTHIRMVGFAGSLVLVVFAAILHWTPWAVADRASLTIVSYCFLFTGFMGAWLSFPDGFSINRKIVVIMLISLGARMLMAGVPESDDVYRYLWEGKIVRAGESPYQFVADHAHYAVYRDAYWEKMNHRDKLTAYPPLAELVFAAVSSLAYSPWAFKLVFIIADLCVVALLMLMLRQYALDVRNVLIYALNPLTLYAFAGEAHFDVLMILAILLSVFCADRRIYAGAWLCLGIAIQIKVIAIVLIPLFLWHCNWRYSWLLLVPLLLPSLYFLGTLHNMLQGLWEFGGMNAFNGPVHSVINVALQGQAVWPVFIVAALFGLVMICIIRMSKNPVKAAYLLISALVLLSPVVHYWYILWVIPFVVLYPALSWLVLSLTSGLYFVSLYSVQQEAEWHLPEWAMWWMWLPFLLVLVYELRFIAVRGLQPETDWGIPKTLAVIVPALNEQDRIKDCLEAVYSLNPPADEVIVCDGGSIDQTPALARQMGACVVNSQPGRGTQILAGVGRSHSDVVLVLHADSVCEEQVSQRILNVLQRNPDLVGGAVGQRFVGSGIYLLVIEMLNDARARLGGASFGDQGQFFRTAAIYRAGGFPGYPLMEDVELSLRMMRVGRTVLLDGGIHNSARQWQQGSLKRIWLIVKLVAVFRWNRLLKRDVTQKLYTIYYNRK
ncbi:glycosyltransferase [Nitrosomonas marina]|uniref:Glycosyl transferase family 2 n=1 Tax=Nitrosomonas marina TaxID=917 RepID=A0A1H8E414_9PROT|nr:glycosyltransferase [Nitrosomonas marina]SEN13854.1 Glycosyl transferase family 2 [Nitrosomonas marina]